MMWLGATKFTISSPSPVRIVPPVRSPATLGFSMIVTRFAPSPTGPLHLGHVHSAFFARDQARRSGGRFLLRIEDIDIGRCRAEFESAIFEDLAWLGLEWETPVRRQSEHGDDYRAALARLRELGVIYPCFCTRAEIAAEIAGAASAPQGPDGPLYPGACRDLDPDLAQARIAEGRPHAWRLDVSRATRIVGRLDWFDRDRGREPCRPEIMGDVVLARRDAAASYHLAVVVDDHLQGVTLVTRGADLAPSTHVHRLLQALLELNVPEWRHHALITDAQGKRLAKRDGARSVATLRGEGATPAEVRVLAGVPNLEGEPAQ